MTTSPPLAEPDTGTASSPTAAPERTASPVRLIGLLLGLTAAVLLMLCSFVLPLVHGAPHGAPIGVTGTAASVRAAEDALAGGEWEIRRYDDARALTEAVRGQEVIGGLDLGAEGITLYTATAAAPQAGAVFTQAATAFAAQQGTAPAVRDLAPFTDDDPRGSGFAAAGLPMIFGGIIPAVALCSMYPGHRHLRTRLAGALGFALIAGFAVTAFLQYGTGSLGGGYLLTGLGMSLGMAAMSLIFLGLESLVGYPGIAAGGVVAMFVANPLSALGSGPHWLPEPWGAIGQILPPGAAGSLLRANAFFDGAGALPPALTLTAWAVLGLALILLADLRGRRSPSRHAKP